MNTPFDQERLDRLMDEAGIDLLLATDKDTVQYLLGGYRFFFMAHKDAIGISRYMPVLGYRKGRPDTAFYIGCSLESPHQEIEPLWVPNIRNDQWLSPNAARAAAEAIRKLGIEKGTIALEMCFIPADAYLALRDELPDAKFVDALALMQALRMIKRPDELELLRRASELIVEVMQDVMTTSKPGTSTAEIAHRIKCGETEREMNFEYCLAAAGKNLNRTPRESAKWNKGDVLSIDSGANLKGYLGDVCRMAVMGEPTQLQKDLLAEVRAIQDAPRKMLRAGVTGAEMYEAALSVKDQCAHKHQIRFFAHGMGMIQHEAPHLEPRGVIPYPAPYQELKLEAGMVLSIETDLKSPEVGLIKLEDTVVVTGNGHEGYGDGARDWTVGG